MATKHAARTRLGPIAASRSTTVAPPRVEQRWWSKVTSRDARPHLRIVCSSVLGMGGGDAATRGRRGSGCCCADGPRHSGGGGRIPGPFRNRGPTRPPPFAPPRTLRSQDPRGDAAQRAYLAGFQLQPHAHAWTVFNDDGTTAPDAPAHVCCMTTAPCQGRTSPPARRYCRRRSPGSPA